MRRFVFCAVLVAGCGPDDKTTECDLGSGMGSSTSASLIQDRRVTGAAVQYAADTGLAARDEELRTSIAARRAVAWDVVQKVLAPVPLGDPRLATSFGGTQPTVPTWATWYARDDFERVFKHLYEGLGPSGRVSRAPIDPEAGFAWNAVALDEVPEWPEQRYLDYLASIDTPELAQGLANATRVGYSPGALGHLLKSYEPMHQCRLNPAPDAFDPSEMREGQPTTAREQLALDKCTWRVLGPFQAGDAPVEVTSRGTGDADIYVRRGEAPDAATYDCKSDGDSASESCEVDGGGPVWVAVFASSNAEVEVDVAYQTADVRLPTCLGGEMPRDAVIVKADWRRQFQLNDLMPVFNTSADRMTARFASESLWNEDGQQGPGAEDIYTMIIPSTGARFRLPALHIMTKELDHWLWITLWYSPFPDTDFGADRPAALASVGPWRNYKMCVATQYLEGDPDPRGGFSGTLGDALAAVNRGTDQPSWCSNPYLELGPGNAATNCIGCHQHGGTELTAEAILADQPHFGVTRVRNNFFTDYMWAVKGGGGEDLSAIVQAEVDYWDAND
ncbi:MAG: PPC domain-containing protein [Kofleriaceae bacterium]